MVYYFIPQGTDRFCIINKKDQLVLDHGDAYHRLRIKDKGRGYLSHYQVFRKNNFNLKTNSAKTKLQNWIDNNYNELQEKPPGNIKKEIHNPWDEDKFMPF